MTTDSSTIQARIARCKNCTLCHIDHCTHVDAVRWTRGVDRSGWGERPWCWQVDICPIGREVETDE